MKIYKLCKPYLIEHKVQLIAYIIIAFAATIISILSPYIIGRFLDNLIEGANVEVVLHFCVIFGGLSFLRIIKKYIISLIYVRLQTEMGYRFNMNVIKHIQNSSLSFIKHDSAYLNQRIYGDTNSLIVFCITILKSVISNSVVLIVPFFILLAINWPIAIILMVFLGLYIILYIAFKDTLYKVVHTFKEQQNKLFSSLYEQLKYVKLIKINSIQPEMCQRADTSFSVFKAAALHNQKISYMYTGMDGFISTFAQIILFVVGGVQVLEGRFTVGMFTIFTSYFSMMLGATRYFFGLGDIYQNALVSHDRLVEVLKQRQESNGMMVVDEILNVEMRDVSFSYSDRGNEVVKNLNTSFSKGKIYVLAGVNGAGKSTIVSLMLGLYIDEYSGSITYNGLDIRKIDMINIRKNQVGFAEQEPTLINGSIRYNLFFNDDNRSIDESLISHIATLNMEAFISKNSLSFQIDNSNTNTSGGEKQKIAILKVLHKDPSLMIFDEPTSALDTETIKRFIKYLKQIKKDKIIIIITHDDAIRNQCDEVIFVR